MTSRIFIRQAAPYFHGLSETPASQGIFDTAAAPDAAAARIRNSTSPAGSISHDWDNDRANAPSEYPEISDRPDEY